MCIVHLNLYVLYAHNTVLYSDWLEEDVCIVHLNLYGLYYEHIAYEFSPSAPSLPPSSPVW